MTEPEAVPPPHRPDRTTDSPFFHVCVVVADLEKATDRMSETLGLHWGDVVESDVHFETPSGPTPTQVRFRYSLEGPPFLEVLERQDGTPWSEVGLHHLGLWGNGSRDTSAWLASGGCPRETVLMTPDGDWVGGLFHILDDGLRIEIVEDEVKPRLARYLGGGPFIDQQ
ncbi:MAG TPA: VOC family protein [Acidimicrobiales bacterium]|nr:VOC family protein [Acidimicrobiales bacterium]